MEGLRSNEEVGGSNRTPSAEEWRAAKEEIKYLYVTKNLPLSEVMEEMEKLGFVAT
jgi:Clr5 domain